MGSKMGGEDRDISVRTEPTVEAVGCEKSTGLGVLSPGFQFGFCCVTLGKLLSLSGHLCCKWTRLFQRSLKTVIPCTCPRMGGYPPRPPPHRPTLLLGFPGTPGGLRGWELAMPVAPPGPSSSTTDLPMPCPLPPPDRQVTPLRGRGTSLASQPAPSLTPAIPCSGHSRSRGLSWPKVVGFAFAPPAQLPRRGQPGTAAVSPHPCVCLSTLFRHHAKGQPSGPNTHF